ASAAAVIHAPELRRRSLRIAILLVASTWPTMGRTPQRAKIRRAARAVMRSTPCGRTPPEGPARRTERRRGARSARARTCLERSSAMLRSPLVRFARQLFGLHAQQHRGVFELLRDQPAVSGPAQEGVRLGYVLDQLVHVVGLDQRLGNGLVRVVQ